MARRKKRSRSSQRDDTTIASPLLRTNPVRYTSPILSLDDRRRFVPFEYDRPLSVRKDQRKVVERVSRARRAENKKPARQRHYKFSFAVPEKVVVCVRRKRRREVLFAMRRTGKGSRKLHRRRDHYSDVRC